MKPGAGARERRVLDFFIEANEDPQFGVYAGEEHSCSQFLRVTRTDIDLKPNQRQTIRYTAAAGDSNPVVYHLRAGLTTSYPSATGSGLVDECPHDRSFYITIGTRSTKVEVKEIALEERGPSPGARPTRLLHSDEPGKLPGADGSSRCGRSGRKSEMQCVRSIPVLPGPTRNSPMLADSRAKRCVAAAHATERGD